MLFQLGDNFCANIPPQDLECPQPYGTDRNLSSPLQETRHWRLVVDIHAWSQS